MSIRKHLNGRWVVDFYPQGRKGKRVRKTFEKHEDAILFNIKINEMKALGETGVRHENIQGSPKKNKRYIQTPQVSSFIKAVYRQSKHRSRAKGLPFDLTEGYLFKLFEQNKRKCILTGILFSLNKNQEQDWRAPYAPSLDRIVPAKGYVEGNVRFVCMAVNVALNSWGQGIFDVIVYYRYKKMFNPGRIVQCDPVLLYQKLCSHL